MASPDHAATIRRHAYHVWPAAMQLPSEQHDPACPGCKIDTALDALVAALARVEHERDAARSRLRDAPRGGAGSHWDGCHLSHIDCANAKRERAERQLMVVRVECPSTGRVYLLRVDPDAYGGLSGEGAARAAVASTWRNPDGSMVFRSPDGYVLAAAT